MTENAEHLANIMDTIEALETVIATNNLILAGMVNDPTVILQNIEASNMLMAMSVTGMRMIVSDDPELQQHRDTAINLIRGE